MAKENGTQDPIAKFTAYNKFAAALGPDEDGTLDAGAFETPDASSICIALLAVAYELKQLNGAVRFGGGSK
jgi:hypothetical protein